MSKLEGPDTGHHARVTGVHEAGLEEVEGYASRIYISFTRVLCVSGHRGAVAVQTTDIPVFRVRDDPTFIIEKKGVIASLVGRKHYGEVAARIDVLGEFHKMAMIEGDDHHAGEYPVSIKLRRPEADHSVVGCTPRGAFRV